MLQNYPAIRLLGLCLITVAVGGCQTFVPTAEINKMMREQKFTPFIPPQGNPASETSWNLRGPGTILRNRNYEVEYEAQHVLGRPAVTEIATGANNPASRIPFHALSGKSTKGNDFDAQGGWSINGAGTVKAKLGLTNATTVDIQFGDTWTAELSEQALRQASGRAGIQAPTVTNLRAGRSHLILKTVYTDSLKLHLNVRRENGGEVGIKVPVADEAKLGGKFKVESDGGVVVSGPVMIGYVAVPREGIAQIFPRR